MNTSGSYNTAIGDAALYSNTNGYYNTANGYSALLLNTTGNNNLANGAYALYYNTNGSGNTANGYHALFMNAGGSDNTANGRAALYNNNSGTQNTADGVQALNDNTSGTNNVALGYQAGYNITGDNNINIGNNGVGGEGNTIRIGTPGTQTFTYIAGISGTPVGGSPVTVLPSGQIGVAPSSRRFKQDIQSMSEASSVLLALRPVTFKYKPNIDPNGTPQFGLVAEDVAKVDPDLVTRDGKGQIFTVRYEAINAMLLNEFLKEHRKVEEQNRKVDQQTTEIQSLKQRLEALEKIILNQKSN